MPDYALVPNAINSLSDRVRGLSLDKQRHEEAMQGLSLAGARTDLELQSRASQQEAALAKEKREQHLDEPVTFGIAISTSKLDDAAKKKLMSTVPEDILNVPTTRRKAFEAYQTMRKQSQDSKEKSLDRTSREKVAGLNRVSAEKIAGMRAGSQGDGLKQMKLESWNAFMQGKATPEQERLIGVDVDPFLRPAAQMLQNDVTMFGKSSEEMATKAQQLAKYLRQQSSQGNKAGTETQGQPGGAPTQQGSVTPEQKAQYFKLRQEGLSKEDAAKQAGIQ